MQKPNFQFEKRRKELDWKAKKEAKRGNKIEAGVLAAAGTATPPSSSVESP
ncbi:MAG TPA: hypothetical protein PLX89_02160 [Verrucomicrobiota bacterium]|nr:hypothetical protein [Verrucomicrobiota bacterium]